MQLFKQIDRLNLLDKLVSQKRTGNPECLARRLNLSVSRLARIIEYLRTSGAPIQYDRMLQTYYYETDYRIFIQVNMHPLTELDAKAYNAGAYVGQGGSIFTNIQNLLGINNFFKVFC
ncbi:hypothetical protein [Pedobacter sp. GR22-6]|uniref:hypothetical protein n=1 Tax=Pedobacter sp. GR22-6 TaxID=3127957 RepID=UPI00307FA63E